MEDLKADDIEDKNAYSIEDAKQKSEYDKMVRLAEEKKSKVRTTIDKLRMEFSTLLRQNGQLPPHLQLNRKVANIFQILINMNELHDSLWPMVDIS